jgi:hypothetical protein
MIPEVILTDRSFEDLQGDHYGLIELGLDGHLLRMRVGISGCGPEHPFQLYMFGGFMESFPVQANIMLAHDGLNEMCDAWWERSLVFDLRPIIRAYQGGYRQLDPIILNFHDFNGDIHRLELDPGWIDLN